MEKEKRGKNLEANRQKGMYPRLWLSGVEIREQTTFKVLEKDTYIEKDIARSFDVDSIDI